MSFPRARTDRHSGQAQHEPESRLDSRPGLLSDEVTFFHGNDEVRLTENGFLSLSDAADFETCSVN